MIDAKEAKTISDRNKHLRWSAILGKIENAIQDAIAEGDDFVQVEGVFDTSVMGTLKTLGYTASHFEGTYAVSW